MSSVPPASTTADSARGMLGMEGNPAQFWLENHQGAARDD